MKQRNYLMPQGDQTHTAESAGAERFAHLFVQAHKRKQ
jgi:hypothetical protein